MYIIQLWGSEKKSNLNKIQPYQNNKLCRITVIYHLFLTSPFTETGIITIEKEATYSFL